MNTETIKEHDEWVTPNSDTLHKSDIKWVDATEPEPINDYEINMLKGTITSDELIKIEKEYIPIELTPEELIKHKTKSFMSMFKIISLDELGYTPFHDTKTFNLKQKEAYKALMEKRVQEYDDGKEEHIKERFNAICHDKIFASNVDVSVFGVGL